jgi:hypothetical protein
VVVVDSVALDRVVDSGGKVTVTAIMNSIFLTRTEKKIIDA